MSVSTDVLVNIGALVTGVAGVYITTKHEATRRDEKLREDIDHDINASIAHLEQLMESKDALIAQRVDRTEQNNVELFVKIDKLVDSVNHLSVALERALTQLEQRDTRDSR